ncbi:MAG: hypothetical protein PWQ88_726 [Candidatus Methanomethylophilaceae archaeon]|nr:hypothetical protein [Candidatus Methanomethylophilaceae archaeon]MDI3541870.1 hypothetical protein [Candidatus Methanomethylophilaceae archaeon]HII99997.1 hypothetical protein [Candidatus Methanomethylophilaceae archaeon]
MMMVVVRLYDYPELKDALKGKRVFLWSCGTCARICGVADRDSISRLAEKLQEDGIELIASQTVSASCLQDHIMAKTDMSLLQSADVVVALCCEVGAETLSAAAPRLNILLPLKTLGQGRRDGDGNVILCRAEDIAIPPNGLELEEACLLTGTKPGPFV